MKEERRSMSDEKFVNYAPAMPNTDDGLFERAVRTLFRRRGGLRPVYRETEEVVVDTTEN